MFSGLKPALTMVEHIQENLNTYARKTQVDEIEKTVEILGKKVYEEDEQVRIEHKKVVNEQDDKIRETS